MNGILLWEKISSLQLESYISYLYLSEKFYCIIYKITNLKV